MPVPAVVALDGVPRHYAWGSWTAIPHLLGIEPDGRPVAELWFGAHPDSPARVPGQETTLDALIAADPVAALGPAVVGRFGPQLPFLVKVLAAQSALSIQVHPTRAQAEAGFAAEDARGIPRDAPERNYRDRNHKPELLCALTPFDALCGFRPVADTLRLLDALDLPALAPIRALLAGPDGLRAAFTALLTRDDPAPLVDSTVAGAAKLAGHGEWAAAARAVRQTAADFPGDVGVVLSLLLNAVRLEPGQALYLGAGNVHAYLRGTGVEIMANSDNVLRCGLTRKHVDAPELLKITDFAELAEPLHRPEQIGAAAWRFAVPAPDFALQRIDLDGHQATLDLDDPDPQIVLCASGVATVQVLGSTVDLTPGRAAFVRARPEGYLIRGSGTAFVATPGE